MPIERSGLDKFRKFGMASKILPDLTDVFELPSVELYPGQTRLAKTRLDSSVVKTPAELMSVQGCTRWGYSIRPYTRGFPQGPTRLVYTEVQP